jgi:hypothetical protein
LIATIFATNLAIKRNKRATKMGVLQNGTQKNAQNELVAAHTMNGKFLRKQPLVYCIQLDLSENVHAPLALLPRKRFCKLSEASMAATLNKAGIHQKIK